MSVNCITITPLAASILDTERARRDFDDLRNGRSTSAVLKNSLRDLIPILSWYHGKKVLVAEDGDTGRGSYGP